MITYGFLDIRCEIRHSALPIIRLVLGRIWPREYTCYFGYIDALNQGKGVYTVRHSCYKDYRYIDQEFTLNFHKYIVKKTV